MYSCPAWQNWCRPIRRASDRVLLFSPWLQFVINLLYFTLLCLWSQLPVSLRQPRINLSSLDSDLSFCGSSYPSINSPLSITSLLIHSRLNLPFSQIPHHRPFPLTGLISWILSHLQTHIRFLVCHFFFLY